MKLALRGEFIRGFDDGRRIDSGRAFGSRQDFMVQRHQHLIPTHSGKTYFPGLNRVVGSDSITVEQAKRELYEVGSYVYTIENGNLHLGQSIGYDYHFAAPTNDGWNNTVGNETRPRNIALSYFIKF